METDLKKQKIICQKGKCHEPDTDGSRFDSMFDSTNVVDQIQKDLMLTMLG